MYIRSNSGILTYQKRNDMGSTDGKSIDTTREKLGIMVKCDKCSSQMSLNVRLALEGSIKIL